MLVFDTPLVRDCGNQRFRENRPLHPRMDVESVKATAENPPPFAAILTCADSRVPPEILFDQGIGDLFTVRVTGNVANGDETASYRVRYRANGYNAMCGYRANGMPGSCGDLRYTMSRETPPARQIQIAATVLHGWVARDGEEIAVHANGGDWLTAWHPPAIVPDGTPHG